MTRPMFRLALALAVAVLPIEARAAAPACPLPASLPRPQPALPSDKEPARTVPITSYTLALIWGPEACFAQRGAAEPGDLQCSSAWNRTHFSLHGLWPDGAGKGQWPQYCKPVALMSEATLRSGLCATPKVQLLQHEWAKHGSCMAATPEAYLAEELRLFAGVHYPAMGELSRRRDLTAGAFQDAFAAANPGMTPDMLRLNVNKKGWLEEVWICLDRDRRPVRCLASQSDGADRAKPLRVAVPAGERGGYRRDAGSYRTSSQRRLRSY